MRAKSGIPAIKARFMNLYEMLRLSQSPNLVQLHNN